MHTRYAGGDGGGLGMNLGVTTLPSPSVASKRALPRSLGSVS